MWRSRGRVPWRWGEEGVRGVVRRPQTLLWGRAGKGLNRVRRVARERSAGAISEPAGCAGRRRYGAKDVVGPII